MRTVGRPAQTIELESIEAVSEDDLESLGLTRPTAEVPHIQRIRETHHNLARCIASGLKQSEVAIRTGYTQSRISSLMSDPAFKALVVGYREKFDQDASDALVDYMTMSHQILTINARQTLEVLEDADEGLHKPLTIAEHLDINSEWADRAGYAKQSRVKHEHDFSDLAARLEAARLRAFGSEGALPQRQVEGPHPSAIRVELEHSVEHSNSLELEASSDE